MAEAIRERDDLRQGLEAEAATIRMKAIEQGEADAATILADARAEAEALLEGTRDATDVALGDAEALSGGLRQLGESLTELSVEILRDAKTAHKRVIEVLERAGAHIRDDAPAPWSDELPEAPFNLINQNGEPASTARRTREIKPPGQDKERSSPAGKRLFGQRREAKSKRPSRPSP